MKKTIINMIKKYFHNSNSFIPQAFHEFSTYIGIIILFGWIYHQELNQLIINILTSNQLLTNIINGLATLGGLLLIMFKQNK